MTPLSGDDILTIIDWMDRRRGFTTSNIKKHPPSFTDIWNRLLAERIQENPNANSFKTMTHRLLRKLVAEGAVSKSGKFYSLTPNGRLRLPLRTRNDDEVREVLSESFSASFVLPKSGPLIRYNSDDGALSKLVKTLEDTIREKGLPEGTKIILTLLKKMLMKKG